jgi:MoaA/NifB/PqqE/SkfB family radical SAM enzyme
MIRTFYSSNYNWEFNTKTGEFKRWGYTFENDPSYSPFGPEILDIEISTICHQGCLHCYKSNTSKGEYMSFEDYKNILDKMENNLTQVALGIGDINYNLKTLEHILAYTRELNIMPNITINGNINKNEASLLSRYCGAVSVSNYDKDICYNAVELLYNEGMKQTNIHQLISLETLLQTLQMIIDSIYDTRLKNINAIIFLLLKPKGDRNNYKPLSFKTLKELILFASKHIPKLGFDSCFAPMVLKILGDNNPELLNMIEPCESGIFSSYVNVKGEYFPCSFSEKENEGLSVLNCNNFLEDIWNNPKTIEIRNKIINSSFTCGCNFKKYCRRCVAYPEITNCLKEK